MILRNITLLALGALLITWSCRKESPDAPSTDQPSVTQDVFPLAAGSTLRYVYQYRNVDRDLGDLWDGTRDSGYVQYRILSSVVQADTARDWTLEETRHLLHTMFLRSGHLTGSPGAWQDSVLPIYLHESLIGSHELQCDGIVWSFPQINHLFYGPVPTFRMYRYAAQTDIIFAHTESGIADYVNDTAHVTTQLGLISRSTWWNGGMMSSPVGNRTAVLLSP